MTRHARTRTALALTASAPLVAVALTATPAWAAPSPQVSASSIDPWAMLALVIFIGSLVVPAAFGVGVLVRKMAKGVRTRQ